VEWPVLVGLYFMHTAYRAGGHGLGRSAAHDPFRSCDAAPAQRLVSGWRSRSPFLRL